MKKLVIVCFSLILCLFAFTACGSNSLVNDYGDAIDALQDRIEQLESDKAELENKIQSQQDEIDALKSTDRVYQLGETFTYVSGGVELFSIKVEQLDINPNSVRMTVKNLSIPGFVPNSCINMLYTNITGKPSVATFSASPLSINGEVSSTSIKGSTSFIWFGYPLSDGIAIYATFKVK